MLIHTPILGVQFVILAPHLPCVCKSLWRCMQLVHVMSVLHHPVLLHAPPLDSTWTTTYCCQLVLSAVWSLNVGWPQCYALCCTRWESGCHQVPFANVWSKGPWEGCKLLYHAALGSPEWSLSGGTLLNRDAEHGPSGQGQGVCGKVKARGCQERGRHVPK